MRFTDARGFYSFSMHGITALSPAEQWIFFASALAIGALCALKDIHRPGELPSLVISVPLHAAVNIAYSVAWPGDFADITQAMLLRSAWLFVMSLFALGGTSVALMLAWAVLKAERY